MRQPQATPDPVPRTDSGRPTRMLASYLCNLSRGPSAVRGMIVSDIKRFSDLGAEGYAADLVSALHLFDRACPQTV